jgi:PilZ domain
VILAYVRDITLRSSGMDHALQHDVGKAPVYPLFLVLPQARARLSTFPASLGPVQDAAAAGDILGADVYYRTATDMAMLALRFDARSLTAELIEQIAAGATQHGAALLDAARLPESARQRFYDSYLPLYDVCLGGLRTPDAALRALGQHLTGGDEVPHRAHPLRDRIEIRFRRGDQWQLARLRSLTAEGVSVATATPPRRGSFLDLEIEAAGVTLQIRSSVVGVMAGEAASTLGATGFGARFLPATDSQRRKLDELLAVAGGEKLKKMAPPPRRREARYPVQWPVFLRTPHAKVSLRALDVSRRGMFIAAEGDLAPREGSVHVTFPVDDGGRPVLATARVARAIAARDAFERGLPVGVGLELISLSMKDEARFAQFVGRIARRADRDVVIGAAPHRLEELSNALAGAGYCTTGITDVPSLVARAGSGRTPDLVILDTSLADNHPIEVQAARKALAVRQVPTITLDGDSPAAAREWVDGALLQ